MSAKLLAALLLLVVIMVAVNAVLASGQPPQLTVIPGGLRTA